MNEMPRKLPIGAELVPDGVHFRIWAPGHTKVEVVFREKEPEAPLK
jgi:maltooligosyltrehalose trehalohydrolase